MIAIPEFIAGIPKAELHLHIEGTLSVATKRRFADRNGLSLSDASFAPPMQVAGEPGSQALAIQQYKTFLALYSEGLKVLRTEQDFYELALEYFDQCKKNNIVYAEISFDPQAHTDRGVAFDAVIDGLVAAQNAARERLAIDSRLIMCINRDLTLESAVEMMEAARPYRDRIAGLGLDNVEEGHPPIKFRIVYDAARDQGYRLTAHCDVDMVDAPEHIRQCIHDIKVERIDHGINVLDDPSLIDAAIECGIHFTACPTWRNGDPKPRRVDRIERMRDLGLSVSLNTDDPAYFESGYLNHMLNAVAATGQWDRRMVVGCVKDAFAGAWIDDKSRADYIRRVDAYVAAHEP